MRATVQLIRAITAFGLGLLLAGCFPPVMTSRAVDIPESERAIDPRLAGTYWRIEDDGSNGDFGLVEIRVDERRNYHVRTISKHGTTDSADEDDIGKAAFVATDDPSIGLLLHNAEGKTTYVLTVRSRAGSLVVVPFLGDMRTRLGKGRTAYLDQVARRHGLAIKWDDEADEAVIGGDPNRERISALFSDPDFLGGLLIEPDELLVLLPSDRPLPGPGDRTAWWGTVWSKMLMSPRFSIRKEQLVRVPTLSGTLFQDGRHATAVHEADGSYRVEYPEPAGTPPHAPLRIRFIAAGHGERLLALVEGREFDEGASEPTREVYHYYIAQPFDQGALRLSPLALVRHDFSPILDRYALSVQHSAAERHGLALADNMIAGSVSARSIGALFVDDQFQSQISCSPGGFDIVFTREAAASDTTAEPAAEIGCRLRD